MSHQDFSGESVLFSTFTILNERSRVYFRRGSLIWAAEKAIQESKIVPVRDIISVDYGHDRGCSCKTAAYAAGVDNEAFQGAPAQAASLKHKKLVVNYAVATAVNVCRPVTVVFTNDDHRQVDTFLSAIQAAIDETTRPKRVLAFVNPNSGKRRGERIYRKSVEPILQLANVKTRLVLTQHADHSKEVIMQDDLSQYDAILTVGGDGTVSEVINALIRRRMADAGDVSGTEMPHVSIPLAVIPGGSTDCIAYTMNGCLDRRTAALYAVLGETAGLDVCSVSSDNGLIKCFVSLLGYGFLGDVLETSEKYRWMGPKRYDFSGVLKFLANKWYHCQITMTLDDRLPAIGPVCYRDCATCGSTTPQEKKTRYQEEALTSIRASLEPSAEAKSRRRVTVTDKFFWVTFANISCSCPRAPVGVAPLTHLGDGTMDVLLVKPRSPIDVLRMLVRSASKDPAESVYDLPFVEAYKVTEVEFTALNRDRRPVDASAADARDSSSVFNCDGEMIREGKVRVRNHRQLIRVLTRCKAPPAKTSSGFCTRCFDPPSEYTG